MNKIFLKYTSRSTHITHKVFDTNFGATHETEFKRVLMKKK